MENTLKTSIQNDSIINQKHLPHYRFPFVDRITRDELFCSRDFKHMGNVTGQEKCCDCKTFAQE